MKDRLTAVGTVYHQPFGEGPTGIEFRFARELETKEQLYSRRLKATEGWQQLDCGWLKDVGMLVIANEEGNDKSFQTQLTDEEREAASKKILEVVYSRHSQGQDRWLVHPGESMMGCPSNVQGLCIRSQSGDIRLTLTLIPR